MITSDLQALEDVEAVLTAFLRERAAAAALTGPAYQRLWEAIGSAVQGGKRVRPRLLLLAHTSFGGEHHEDAVIAAAAFELLHTALLFHDDALDGDLLRRGRPNLQGTFAAEAASMGLDQGAADTWASAAGVVAGDLLISAVHALVSAIDTPYRARLHAMIDECLFTTAAGELADIGLAVGTIEPTLASITSMMKDKTAMYSFVAPLRAGAHLAGARLEAETELAEIGAMLGLLYQLRDDVLGVFGTQQILGKSTDGDLREGKHTLLIAHAEGSQAWEDVRHLFGRPHLTSQEADLLRSALVRSGALERAERYLSDVREEVMALLDRCTLPGDLAAHLTLLARECSERDA